MIDAAVAIVLAGTSVAELIGQNVPPDGTQTPHLRPAYKTLLADPIPDPVEEFFKVYDCMRHFGPAKHQAVAGITEERLCNYLTTAQSVWTQVLTELGATVGDDFQQIFRF